MNTGGQGGQIMLRIFENFAQLSSEAAKCFAEKSRQEIAAKGLFTAVMSGGSTPRQAYAVIAEDYGRAIEWSKVHLFWGDERDVQPESQDSNYKMAKDSLLSKIEIPAANIHRIQSELGPKKAAEIYNREIAEFFCSRGLPTKGGVPSFDFIFLGIGEDGHTASLFVETTALMEKQSLVVDNYVPKLKTTRITFTARLINRAKFVLFLVSGAAKAEALKNIFDEKSLVITPSKLIHAQRTEWFVDSGAAALLGHAQTKA